MVSHTVEVSVSGTPSRVQGGLLSNTQKLIVQGDTRVDKARNFIGKGHLGGQQGGQGTQENWPAMSLTVLGFMVIGLV